LSHAPVTIPFLLFSTREEEVEQSATVVIHNSDNFNIIIFCLGNTAVDRLLVSTSLGIFPLATTTLIAISLPLWALQSP